MSGAAWLVAGLAGMYLGNRWLNTKLPAVKKEDGVPVADLGDPFTYVQSINGSYYRNSTDSAVDKFFHSNLVAVPNSASSDSKTSVVSTKFIRNSALTPSYTNLWDFIKAAFVPGSYVLTDSDSLLNAVSDASNDTIWGGFAYVVVPGTGESPSAVLNRAQSGADYKNSQKLVIVATPLTGIPALGIAPNSLQPSVGYFPGQLPFNPYFRR